MLRAPAAAASGGPGAYVGFRFKSKSRRVRIGKVFLKFLCTLGRRFCRFCFARAFCRGRRSCRDSVGQEIFKQIALTARGEKFIDLRPKRQRLGGLFLGLRLLGFVFELALEKLQKLPSRHGVEHLAHVAAHAAGNGFFIDIVHERINAWRNLTPYAAIDLVPAVCFNVCGKSFDKRC